MGGQFLGLGEAYIPNLSLLVCLEAFKKFVWWWWWWWLFLFLIQIALQGKVTKWIVMYQLNVKRHHGCIVLLCPNDIINLSHYICTWSFTAPLTFETKKRWKFKSSIKRGGETANFLQGVRIVTTLGIFERGGDKMESVTGPDSSEIHTKGFEISVVIMCALNSSWRRRRTPKEVLNK